MYRLNSRLWSAASIQMVTTSINRLESPKTTCSSFVFRQVCSFAGIRRDEGLEVQEVFGNRHDVLQIESPTQHHLDGQGPHQQEQIGHEHEADKAHLDVEFAENRGSHDRW